MREIDAKSKQYLKQRDVFADAFNYYIYDGQPVIQPEKLRERDITELSVPYGKDGAEIAVQKYRDVLKLAILMTDEKAAYLMLGLEAQKKVHYAAPVRNMLYDALQYAGQAEKAAISHRKAKDSKGKSSGEFLSGFYKEDKLIPVVTLVLFLSPEPWDGPLSIHQMLDVQDRKLLSMVPDYRIHLITPHDLKEESLNKLHTSLREVLQFIKYSENKGKMRELVSGNERYLAMDPEAVSLLNSCLNMDIQIEEEETVNMCKAWEDMKMESRIEGRAEGRAEGEERYAKLTSILLDKDRYGDLKKASIDPVYRTGLYREFCL